MLSHVTRPFYWHQRICPVLYPTLLFSSPLLFSPLLLFDFHEGRLMSLTNISTILFICIAGSLSIHTSNWTPFFPKGFKGIIKGTSLLLFSSPFSSPLFHFVFFFLVFHISRKYILLFCFCYILFLICLLYFF